jgi:hypothetical protein
MRPLAAHVLDAFAACQPIASVRAAHLRQAVIEGLCGLTETGSAIGRLAAAGEISGSAVTELRTVLTTISDAIVNAAAKGTPAR